MKTLIIGAFLGLCATMAHGAPRTIALEPTSDGSGSLCAADASYCAKVILPDTLEITTQGRSLQIPKLPLREGETPEPAAMLIELAPGHILAGAVLEAEYGTISGRFKRRDLLLWDVKMADGSIVGPVLDFPVHALVSVDADCRNWPKERATRCDATYEFNSIFDVIRAESQGYPVLTYRTAALRKPGLASREFGWNADALLGPDDDGLDTTCTFKRSFTYNPLSGRYTLDEAFPDCDEFLEPDLLPRRAKTELREVWMRLATEGEVKAFVSAETQSRLSTTLSDPRFEIGWIYNEMATGNDILVLRVSDGGRCQGGDCDLHFFATRNCVEPALCTGRWVESRKGNRAYTVYRPQAPLDLSCPQSLVLISVGRDAGQHCLEPSGMAVVHPLPPEVAQSLSKE